MPWHLLRPVTENTVPPIKITFASPGEHVANPRLQHVLTFAVTLFDAK